MTEEKTLGKKQKNIYLIIIAVLAMIILFLGYKLMQTKTQVETVIVEKQDQRTQLQGELDNLMIQHEKIKTEYGEVSDKLSEKDSVIAAKAQEIERLIATQADYYRIKRKLEYLRNSHQRYVEQIDSLFVVNRELKVENKQIKSQYQQTISEKDKVTKEKEQLEEKVGVGALLKAYAISADAIHMGGWTGDKEKIVDKARRLDKIKICFTIGENLIAQPGERIVYLRIARPDNKILYKRSEDHFMYNGEKLQYSLKKTIDYQNSKQSHCLYWKKDENAKSVMEGNYTITIFVDDQEVGQTIMRLE
ncbi:MAG: hypothetical protein R6T91_03880 [Bacteroidales bacterium]